MSGKNQINEIKDQDCKCYAKARNPDACPPVRNVTHPLRYYEFTQDEIKVLEECDKESFYQRCLPFSTLFAGFTYAAIRSGFLKRNPYFGAVPKIIMAAVFGHVYGRVSYLSKCDEKIRELLPPKSHLAQVMRKYHEDKKSLDPNIKKK